MAGFPNAVPLKLGSVPAVLTPRRSRRGLGSSGFARRYSRNRLFFLFLRLLRCFSSPGSPPCPMDSDMDAWGPPMRVSPFRHLRISGRVPLPAAFRSLPRLSSALSAKASALRPFLLDLSPPHSVAAVLPPPAHGCAGGAFSYFFISDVLMFQGFSLLVLYGVFKVHGLGAFAPRRLPAGRSSIRIISRTLRPRAVPAVFLLLFYNAGSRLLSHAVPSIVSSAACVLTIVFGMGTGVSRRRIATSFFPPPRPPPSLPHCGRTGAITQQ